MNDNYLRLELYQRFRDDPALFDFLQAGSLDGLWYWDLENPSQEWMSPEFWRLFGYDPESKQHLASEWQDIIFPDDLQVTLENIHKHLADPSHPYDQTVRYRHKDGSTVWVRSRGIAIRDAHGKAIRMLGAHTDITAQKRAEERLAEANRQIQAQLSAVFDASADAIFTMDRQGAIETLNAAAQQMFGYGAQEMKGQPITGIVPAERMAEHASRFQAVLAGASIQAIETTRLRKDGAPLSVELSMSPLKTPDGTVLGALAIIRDQTRRSHAEQALQRENEKNHAILRNASDGIHILGIDGNIIDVSDSFCAMLGYARAEMLSMNVARWDAQFPPSEILDQIRKQYAARERVQFETRHRRKDGSTFDVEISGRPLELDGKPAMFYSSRDISERIRIERELRTSEEKLRGLYELSPLGIALTDMQGRYIEFNQAFEHICGYSAEELKALDYWTLTPKKYEADEARQLESLKHGGRYGPYEKEYVRKDGRHVPLRLNGMEISGNDGQKYIWSIVEDITDRVAAEENLRKLSTVVEQNPASIVITDLDATIQYVNPRFTKVTGYELDEAIGQNPRILKSGLTSAETYRDMWQSLTRGRAWHGELLNRRKNGELYWEEVHLAPVKNAMGVATHYVGVKVEITQRKRAEEAIRQSEARFRHMLETSPIAVRIASASGREVLFANQRYAELIGSPPDGAIGLDPKAYYARPEDYENVLERLSRGERLTDMLVELLVPGSKPKWALASYYSLEYAGETAVLGWFYDITERKEMERILHESEARLIDAQHIAHLGNWELDPQTGKLWWSKEIFRIFEIGPKDFGASYEAFLAAIHPDDRDAVDRAYLDSIENRTPYDIVHRLLFPGGRVKYVHERCQTDFAPDGKPLRSRGTAQDITERRLAEIEREQSEATSRALIDATAETAMLLDREGTVLAINAVGASRLGGIQEEIVGRNFYELLPPPLARTRKAAAKRVLDSGTATHIQDMRNGMHFDITVYPVFDSSGRVVNLAVYAADITEQLQLQGVDQLLHGIDQRVLRSQSIQQIFEFICAEVARIFAFPYIWIGSKEAGGAVSIVADAGPAKTYREELEQVGVRWDNTPQGKGPTGATIRTGQTQVFKRSDEGFRPWRESAERHAFEAILGLPLVIRGEIYGAFTVYSEHESSFDAPEVLQRLSGIASRICVAVETARDQQQVVLLSTALSATANGVFITDKSGRILWVNKAFTVLTGYGEDDALGTTPRILKSGRHDAAFIDKMWRDILRGEVWRDEMEDRRKDGSSVFVRQTITPIRDTNGEVSHFIAILEDISAEKEAAARIEHMAHYDSLTNLPNRALFLNLLRQTLASARRESHPGALMFLDLDRFKSVNDTLGHHAGDLLLQQVAGRIRACVRESDTVARLAGDEFTIILPEITIRDDAARVAEKILKLFGEPFDLDGQPLLSSTSIGIALFPKDATNEDDMLRRADSAMYAAKKAGRNQYAFFDAD